MSRLTKDEIQTKLEQETYRANVAVINLAKLKGGLKALITMIEDSDITDLDDAADMLQALLESDQPNLINHSVQFDGPRDFVPGEQ